MNKIYTLMKKSDVNWKDDVLYPITLFSVACLILLLSSFGTKASYENAAANEAFVTEAATETSEAMMAECCERTVSHTKGCEGDRNYVFYLRSSKKDISGNYENDSYYMSSSSEISWIECDNQVNFKATNLKANSGSAELIDLDITYSGLTSNAPVDSPKANICYSPNTGGWMYYTQTNGLFTSNVHGTYSISQRGEAFQIGAGANVQATSGFGASGWFTAAGGNGHWEVGDVNVQLSQACSTIGGNNPTCNLEVNRGDDIDLCNNETATLTANTSGASDCSDCCTRPIINTQHCDGQEDYAFWVTDGKDNKRYSADGLVWMECGDGTATIIGQAIASDGEIAIIDAMYSGFTSTPPVGSPKDSNCNGASGNDYDYYTILTGSVTIGGVTYGLSRRGEAFQVGNGANVTHVNTDLGGSGWFELTDNGRWDRGDFNIQLGSRTCQDSDLAYLWSGPGIDGSSSQAVDITGPGTYSVTVTDCNGCTATDNVAVTESSITADAGDDQTICNGAKATLTATGGASYVWSTGETTANIMVMPNTDTEYTVVVTDELECEGTAAVMVFVNEFAEAQASNNGPITCATGDITITALPNGSAYAWSGPNGFISDTQSLQVGVAGTYTVTVTNADGCEDIVETIVEADEAAPDATVGNNGPICEGESIEITSSSSTGNISYTWEGEGLNTNQITNQNNTIAGLAPGSYDYTITVTNLENGCTTSATTIVVVNANPASGITAQDQVCAGEVAQFAATPAVTDATYSWAFEGPATPATSADAVVDVIWADVPGNYTATLTVEKDGCVSTFDHEIAVTFEVIANAGPDTTICQGGTAILDGRDSQGNGFLWEVVEGDPTSIDLGGTASEATVSPLTTTTYRLKVDDVANNCTKVDEVTVFVDVNLNPIADAGDIQSICQGDKVTLDATGSSAPPAKPNSAITYFWSPANLLDDPTSATPMATISETTTFDLIVVSEDGCIDESSVVITVVPCDVALEKTVNNATPNPGDVVTFTISVTNEGELPLSGIEIQDVVPNGFSSIANISNGGTATGNTVTWSGISLPLGGSTSVTFDATVEGSTGDTDYLNTAQVTAMDQLDIDSEPGNDDGDQSEDDEGSAGIVPNGSIWGAVLEDTDGDGIRDTPLAGVTLTLRDAAGNVITTAVTDADGKYDFIGLAPGDYTVEQTQPADFRDISDMDGSPDGDTSDSDNTVDNIIMATVNPGEADMDNDFVEQALTSIWGDVTADSDGDNLGDAPLEGITITLKDAASNVIAIEVTDADGKYDFVGLPAGDYIVEQTQPADFRDVSDEDESPDGDAGDSDTAVDNSITVTTTPGEADMDNDFVEQALTSIWGDVTEDLDGDGLGDAPIAGVTITLKDAAGVVLQTAVTDADGKYDFVGLPAGDYIVEETQPVNFRDVSDQDESPDGDAGDSDTAIDNSITVTTTPGEADMDNDFVEEGLTSIWGDVTADSDNDGLGDTPIPGVTITLKDAAGNVIATAVTDADGKYDFVDLPAGDYIVEQAQPAGFSDESDFDESPDGDAGDSDTAQDNSITVTTVANEADMDNDFVEVALTSIWGDVTEDIDGDGVGDAPIAGVTITLKNAAGFTLATQVTDADGKYDFVDLVPGDYVVEQTQPADYIDVSDRDESPDGDVGDSDTTVDNSIAVTTTPGEADMDNDFIEEGLTSIWGDVTEDVDGDGTGDLPISGVTITLRDAAGNVLDTEVTDADGKYDFTGLPAGDYLVEETQPAGFSDVSDRDESADGDAGDSDTTVDNAIAVTTVPNEADMDNDFIEEKLASISGSVLEDIDNDDAGDRPISGVTILLKDAAGNTVAQDITDANGFYEFLNLSPGVYTLMEMQPDGFEDVSDEDATPDPDGGNDPQDDNIPVILAAGENDDDNNFIEEQLVSVGSTIFEDANDNGIQDAGEPGIPGVPVAIFADADMDGLPDNANPIAQDVSDANGNYYLGGLEPGKYVVIVQAPAGILNTSSTANSGDDGVDGNDNGFQPLGAGTPVASASIVLTPGTEPINESAAGGNSESANGDLDENGDMTIDFGFFAPGSLGDFVWFDINGNGQQDAGEPGLQGVTVNLLDANGNVVNTTTTDANGQYLFAGLSPDTYIVEFVTPSSYTEVISTGTDVNDGSNSDYDPATNRTAPIIIVSGVNELDVDAGFNLLLDISLVSFTGRYVEDRDHNAIEWITSTELDADYYILERAFGNEDFQAINRVDAKGSSSAETLYSYDDNDIREAGVYTYRLQLVSNDGSSSYGDVISVNVRRTVAIDPSITVYPNPVKDVVNVDVVKGESDVVSIKMFDLTGKVINITNLNVNAGAHNATLQFSVGELPRATYILRINIGDQVFAKKINLVQ